MEHENKQHKEQNRKNRKGQVRVLGSKDYSLILTNLMAYKRQLSQEEHLQKSGNLMRKISTKMKELGFESEAIKVKEIVGRKKNGKYQSLDGTKCLKVENMALKVWKKASVKQEEAKKKLKEEKSSK